MRAAVLKEFGRPLTLDEVPIPNPIDGEVLIRVRAAGLCATDLKLVAGMLTGIELPRVVGHEVAGDMCTDTPPFRRGQRVACYIYVACGGCRECERGRSNLCPRASRIGLERDGGFAEYIAIPIANALPFPDHLPYSSAAVAMDAVATPWHALFTRARLARGERLVVAGGGGLGLNAVQIGVAHGATVALIEPIESRRLAALEMGAEMALSPEEVGNLHGRFDVALEASGTASGFHVAATSLAPGGRMVCCGYRPDLEHSIASPRLVLSELTIMGSRASSLHDARAALDSVVRGTIRPTVASEADLGEVNSCLERLARSEGVGRMILVP